MYLIKNLKKIKNLNILSFIKHIWFFSHKFYMYFSPFFWVFSDYYLILYFFIILSWALNDNQCLITQLEYYIFNETFLGKEKKFYVPFHNRFILYFNFFIGLCYYLYNCYLFV